MAMIPEVLSSYAQVHGLRVAGVVSYLQQHNWMAISHPNPRLLVFENGVDDQGTPIQVVLPSQDDYEDTPYLLTKAINLISILQSVSFQEIINTINGDVRA
jgi:hypothetical protein